VLIADQTIVGYMGAVYAERLVAGKTGIVCNLSSWYIDPKYRGWGATMLNAIFAYDPSLTYTAFTAAPLPKALFKAMQFIDVTDKSLVLPPLSHATTLRKRPTIQFAPEQIRGYLSDAERRVLDDHSHTDCLHVLLREGNRHAYMVTKRRRYRLARWSPWVVASKMLYCSGEPDLVIEHLEWTKLAILLRQRTLALVISVRWFSTPPSGVPIESHMLMRSAVFAPGDLDMLYSEVCLLPV
jgi:hypothetical protein